MARRVDHSFIDTVDTRVQDTERRTMAAVEVVNLRVTYHVDVRRRERLAYEQESIETRQALARSEAYSRELEARIRVLETQVYRHEWQRQDADDRAIEHIIQRLAYEQESIETRQALAISKAYSRALEARIGVLETQAYHHEWQRQDADDRAI
ncbi:hypothetical protein Tco_0610584 [Tanacetum coccineum]